MTSLDGDGASDIMIHNNRLADDEEGRNRYATTLFAGATGEVRWTRVAPHWLAPLTSGDYDDNGTIDVLALEPDFFGHKVVHVRRDGATGAELPDDPVLGGQRAGVLVLQRCVRRG